MLGKIKNISKLAIVFRCFKCYTMVTPYLV